MSTTETKMEGQPPRVWLLLSDKLGDNAQVEAIAQLLGRPYEIKRVYPLAKYALGKPRFKPSLHHIDLTRSDVLQAPWPEYIITIGRRPAMVAMWIYLQSHGRTRVVLLGRPRRWLNRYELVVVPSQYRVPQRSNILHLDLPLMRLDNDKVSAARKHWQAHFSLLKPPVIALLVGGQTRPFRLDAKVAQQLMRQVNTLVEKMGGTLYVTTSRRTSAQVVKVVENYLPQNACLYRFGDGGDNPYFGLLALADYFVVTGDSVSMMVEVARCKKPLAIYPLPIKWWGKVWAGITSLLHPEPNDKAQGGFFKLLGRVLFRLGIVGYSRDLTLVHRYLVDNKFAVPLGSAFHERNIDPPDELQRVAERIKQLLDDFH